MKQVIFVGDIFKFDDGAVGRVLSIFEGKIRLRKARACVGKHSKKSRVGEPYTYQVFTTKENLFKKSRKLGTHEILLELWWAL
jgi:hypothetical protein